MRLVQTYKYDSIIIELNLPQVSGFELGEFLRKEINYKGPLIAVTCDNPKDVEEKCYKVGFDEIIVKPLQPRELVHVILELSKKYAKKPPYKINKNANIDRFIAERRYRAGDGIKTSSRGHSTKYTSSFEVTDYN